MRRYLALCRDGSGSFIVERSRDKGTVYQISAIDGQCTESHDIPARSLRSGVDVIMIDGVLLNGGCRINDLYAYDPENDRFAVIPLD